MFGFLRRRKTATLSKEVSTILGSYKPGGVPVVYIHADESPEIISVHEQAHRDLARNTLYGWAVQVLLSPEGRSLEQPQQIAERMLGRAWTVFEGHATWMELAALRQWRGEKAAFDSYKRLPRAYRRAVCSFADTALLRTNLYYVQAALIFALAEYAADRQLMQIAARAATIEDLIRDLDKLEVAPDEDLKQLRALATAMTQHDRTWLVVESAVLSYTEETSSEDRARNLALFRGSVEELKRRIHVADRAALKIEGDPALLTMTGMRQCLARLFGDSYRESSPEERLKLSQSVLLDSVIVQNSPDAPITTPRIEVTLEQLTHLVAAEAANEEHTWVCSCGSLTLFDPNLLVLMSDQLRQEMESYALESGAARFKSGQMKYSLEVTRIRRNPDSPPQVYRTEPVDDHLAYVTDKECLSYLQLVAQARPQHCVCLLVAGEINGEFFVPQVDLVPMPGVVYLRHYGDNALRSALRSVRTPDYIHILGISVDQPSALHVLVVGRVQGPRFVMIGPGSVSNAQDLVRRAGASDKLVEALDDHEMRITMAAILPVIKGVYSRS